MKPERDYISKVQPATRKDSAGLTLVEIMVALSLLTIVAVGVMSSFSSLFSSNRANAAAIDIQLLTERVVQELEAVPPEQLLSWDGSSVEENGITVGIRVSKVAPTLLQLEATGTRTGREGGQFTLVSLRAER
ncbi:MAG: prepilin-type N-terminal cleavage/methylation domain-containing protein [Planctomycetota bacterium]|jgi:prepilin-type N-terminal cleavage/methylation domain-containing protein